MDTKTLRVVIVVASVITIATTLWWVLACRCISLAALNPLSLRDYIRGFGPWSTLVYVVLYAFNTVSVLPPIGLLSLTAGLLFGKVLGALLLMIGAMLG